MSTAPLASYYAVEQPASRWKARFTPTLGGRPWELIETDTARLRRCRFRLIAPETVLLLALRPLLLIAQIAILLLQDAVMDH